MRDNLKRILVILLLLLLGLAAVTVLIQGHSATSIQQQLVETRRHLREQGFKTDLADFHFSTDADLRSRAAALTSFGGSVSLADPASTINLLPVAPDGSAVVIWREEWLPAESGSVTWSELHDDLEANGPALDFACQSVLSGPIQFDLDASRGRAMLLPHLADLRQLGQALAPRVLVELHDQHPAAAWTNLLALTRLATAWRVEPAEVSCSVRFVLLNVAFQTSWQALQAGNWSDAQLACLQREWESPNFFTNLPDVAAFQRASDVALCQQERAMPRPSGFLPWAVRLSAQHPAAALVAVKQYWHAVRYRSYGSYDDEKNLLLFFTQREQDQRRALAAPTWAQMQALPNVTNLPAFNSTYNSRMLSALSMSLSGMRMNNNSSLFARAALAEARRRLVVTAIALERYAQKHGAYPATLAALAPEWLAAPPVDFMDGRPLRYQLGNDGHFILYSVGLNLVDNGGVSIPPVASSTPSPRRSVRSRTGEDLHGNLLWPRPASAAVSANLREMAINAAQLEADEQANREADSLWAASDKRQGLVDTLLAAPAITNAPDVKVDGHSLSQTLNGADGTNLFLAERLTLRQIITGSEPETVTFELPVSYDAITRLGTLSLLVDPDSASDEETGAGAQFCECLRAPSGNCRLVWPTIYEAPGKHALQAVFSLNQSTPTGTALCGPFLPFTLTNFCQFTPGSAHFQTGMYATWRARLSEANARYVIELSTTNATHLKTITGSTTNGELKVTWNLVDDHNQRFTGEEFDSVFQITLPDSGRTQTLRGP